MFQRPYYAYGDLNKIVRLLQNLSLLYSWDEMFIVPYTIVYAGQVKDPTPSGKCVTGYDRLLCITQSFAWSPISLGCAVYQACWRLQP